MTMAARILLAFTMLIGFGGMASAQPQCTREGIEYCQGGYVYRCETCNGVLCGIFQNRRCDVDARTIDGSWSGSVTQTPAGSQPAYPVTMTINGNSGSIDYPSLGCGGSLSKLSGDSRRAMFRESITRGANRCINGGTLTVDLVNGRLAWSWSGTGSDGQHYVAVAVLER